MKIIRVAPAFLALVSVNNAEARPQVAWENDFRAELANYLGSQACKSGAYNMRKLKQLRREAARDGYAASMNRIAREEGWKRAHTNVMCAQGR